MSQRWRVVGNAVSDLNGPSLKPRSSRSRNFIFNYRFYSLSIRRYQRYPAVLESSCNLLNCPHTRWKIHSLSLLKLMLNTTQENWKFQFQIFRFDPTRNRSQIYHFSYSRFIRKVLNYNPLVKTTKFAPIKRYCFGGTQWRI